MIVIIRAVEYQDRRDGLSLAGTRYEATRNIIHGAIVMNGRNVLGIKLSSSDRCALQTSGTTPV